MTENPSKGSWTSGSSAGARTNRRTILLGALATLLAPAAALRPGHANTAEPTFFRIGTGSTSGTYYPVGGLIASAISNPVGSRSCERGGSCGVPGLIAVAQSTSGSVENVEAIALGQMESGFCQADVAYWASTGTGIYEAIGARANIRSIANLYPETLHLIVRQDLGVHRVSDLRGKRISVDREGSGSRVDAMLVLEAYGLGPDDLEIISAAPGVAADLLRAGELDGFFMVVGAPGGAISDLADDSLITLVPIDGPEAAALAEKLPFLAPEAIPSGTYFNVPYTETLSVGAQWLVGASLPEEQVYEITRALWHDSTRRLLDSGHPKGRLIRIETALDGLGVPLHPGAERYYQEMGLLANK